MRQTRWLAALAVLALQLGTAPGISAQPMAVTLHGTFSEGLAISAGDGGSVVFGLPLGGVWNLNINMATGTPRATAQFIVRYVPDDAVFGMPAHGLHALWVPSFLALKPLTAPSPAAGVIPQAAGVVNDPAHGVYAFGQSLPTADVVVIANVATGHFFYAAAATAMQCPPADVDPMCFDSVLVAGSIGR